MMAQFTYVMDQNIAVKDKQGRVLTMPWAGGLNAAHYNTMDLNGDVKDDLVIFDRMADKLLTFINQDNKYIYTPEYEAFFPDDITNWLLLRDFNCDGKKDIFTGNIFGIKVLMNVTATGESISWKPFSFATGFPGSKSEVLLTKGFSGRINLQLQPDDLPAITDADGDGDLDIFNVRFVGQGTLEYHQNFSMERYGTCDSLDFERVTQKWGNFTECDCAEFAFNDEDCAPVGGRTKHQGGKSLLMIDVDGNSNLDILFSEAECTNLFVLKNEGTTQHPIINSHNTFPAATPIDFHIFPAAFYEDVDFDGIKDLLSIPNIFSKTIESQSADLSHSNWLYKNNGSNTSPVFNYVTNAFLQDQMIDVGDNAVPAFIDHDGDGDQDLFVSHNNTPTGIATVRLYENVGTPDAPAFSLTNEDAFGFSNLTYYNLKIQFADINRDSKRDLVFTATSLINGQTKLYFIPNKSSSTVDLNGQEIQEVNISILSSENVSVVDVDSDGFHDLLIGKSNGALQYWRNQKQAEPLSFSLADDTFLAINPNVVRQNITSTSADLDSDGKMDLILGDQHGVLNILSNFRDAVDTTGQISDLIYNSLTKQYESGNLGGRLWPTTANIFNTSKPSIIVGNVLGGIHILRNDEGESLPKEPAISIYPNPVFKGEYVTIEIDRAATVQVFNALGQVVTSAIKLYGNEKNILKTPYLGAGVYLLRFTASGRSFVKRLVIY
ncbi:T9SS type A sorting domain-containing protein [Chryseolinea sp. H1M3-3]|uniref:T9SS type A sorting domain-containing protein n=1 Tax=Chryseolinea sp. H1M3-3 TaxID=3034144 RepID=UPI0023EC957D|nr:T9SS type A sorting domain-containing protein [Chryseolinea sp. H1M3-3]